MKQNYIQATNNRELIFDAMTRTRKPIMHYAKPHDFLDVSRRREKESFFFIIVVVKIWIIIPLNREKIVNYCIMVTCSTI